MIKVMLVDDEVLALDYLKNMIDWEQQGFQISGCVSNGKRALELYDRVQPEVVISDIKMPGMDGLELTRQLKLRNPDVTVLLLSAYKDFDYAQKGIQYGVSNYLLKHELREETLKRELERVRVQLEKKSRDQKIYQKYFMNQLIYHQPDTEEMGGVKLGNRLFLLLLHKSDHFFRGGFVREEWTAQEQGALAEALEGGLEDCVFYVADVQITSNNLIVLYRIEHTSSKSKINSLIEQKSAQIVGRLSGMPGCRFHMIYSDEIRQEEISGTFRKMSQQIRYAAFWKLNRGYPLVPCPQEEEKITWGEQIRELRESLYEEGENPGKRIGDLFQMAAWPEQRLESCRELMQLLEQLLRETEEKEGMSRGESGEGLYTMEEVKGYYEACFSHLYQCIHEKIRGRYSRTVLEMMRYIRKHYSQDLSLERMGEIFHMNGVYLGQMFKKEVGVTFLKYVTNLRMEEAKRILREENSTVTEAAKQVGYHTSQYFSQIFTKNVGMSPQEYKKWNEEA